MKYAIIISAITSILLSTLVYIIITYACQTSFQRLVAVIGVIIIILLMNIESKIDKLINKK